jgi:hypothetical protein
VAAIQARIRPAARNSNGALPADGRFHDGLLMDLLRDELAAG